MKAKRWMVVCVWIAAALMMLSACTDKAPGDTNTTNLWDQMRWDQGKWQ